MRYLLVDAANTFIRNYVVVPTLSAHGAPIGAVEGFLKSLKSFIDKCKPDKVILIWDGAGGSQRRRELVKEYKLGRKPYKLNRNYDFELVDQEQNKIAQRVRLNEYLIDLPVTQIMIDNIEADDTIAYLVNHFPDDQKVIVSTDKDFVQLLSSKTIIYNSPKKSFFTSKDCVKTFGVYPYNFVIVRAIVGDPSDNLKGVKSVGMKNILKYFPFLSEEREINLEEIFAFCKSNENKKYKKFLEHEDIINNNLKIMQLANPIISFQSVSKIKESLEQQTFFNPTSFRLKLIQDGIMSINDNYFSPFKILSL